VLAVDQALLASAIGPVSNAIGAARLSLAEAERIHPFANDTARRTFFDEAFTLALEALRNPPVRVETTGSEKVNAQIAQGFEQTSPGQLVTWVLITLVGAAEVVVNERLGGTLRRLLTTPTSQATILAGKIAGRLTLGILQMALLIGFGALALGVNWGRSLPALVLVVLAFALSAVAFGVLLGTLAKTRSQASGLTILFSMLPAALGGAWWPIEVTPKVYQAVVQALPTTWAMKGFSDVIIRGEGIGGVLPETAILLGFALLFFALGIRRFRFE
jgi:ABC-2 type transport system permease protein